MSRAISEGNAKEELKHIHDLSYGGNDISLTDASKDRVTTSPKWQGCCQCLKELLKVSGVPRRRQASVHLKGRRLKKTIPQLSLAPLTATKSLLHDEDSKEVVKGLYGR